MAFVIQHTADPRLIGAANYQGGQADRFIEDRQFGLQQQQLAQRERLAQLDVAARQQSQRMNLVGGERRMMLGAALGAAEDMRGAAMDRERMKFGHELDLKRIGEAATVAEATELRRMADTVSMTPLRAPRREELTEEGARKLQPLLDDEERIRGILAKGDRTSVRQAAQALGKLQAQAEAIPWDRYQAHTPDPWAEAAKVFPGEMLEGMKSRGEVPFHNGTRWDIYKPEKEDKGFDLNTPEGRDAHVNSRLVKHPELGWMSIEGDKLVPWKGGGQGGATAPVTPQQAAKEVSDIARDHFKEAMGNYDGLTGTAPTMDESWKAAEKMYNQQQTFIQKKEREQQQEQLRQQTQSAQQELVQVGQRMQQMQEEQFDDPRPFEEKAAEYAQLRDQHQQLSAMVAEGTGRLQELERQEPPPTPAAAPPPEQDVEPAPSRQVQFADQAASMAADALQVGDLALANNTRLSAITLLKQAGASEGVVKELEKLRNTASSEDLASGPERSKAKEEFASLVKAESSKIKTRELDAIMAAKGRIETEQLKAATAIINQEAEEEERLMAELEGMGAGLVETGGK